MSVMAGGDTRNVKVNLTANVSPYQRAIQDAGKATTALTAGVVKLGKSIDDLVKRAGKKMVLLGTGDIAGLVAAAEAANRLDVAMTQVRATSALTGQSVGRMRGEILNLSRSIPDSTSNIARLAGEIQNLGIQGTKNIGDFVKMAEQLGAATNTPPGQLLEGIIQMNKEMGTGLATVSNYSSALIELTKMSGTAAGDVLGFAQSIQSVAQQAGFTQTQVLGISNAFAKAGADSQAAANVFITIQSEINQAVLTNNAQLEQFGKLVGMTAQQFRDFAKTNPAKAMESVLSGIQGEGQRGILTLQQMNLDGPRALRVIAALTSGQANLAQSMDLASAAYSRNSALTKSSSAAWNDLSSDMQKFRNMVNDIVIRLGGPMLHALDIMVKGINAVLGPLNTFLGYLGPIPGIVAAIGGAFLAVTGTITMFSVALLAAAGAYRALTGQWSSSIFMGMKSGRRAAPGADPMNNAVSFWRGRRVNMNDPQRTGPGRFLYRRAFAAGQMLPGPGGGGPASAAEDPTMARRIMRAPATLAMWPLRKIRYEGNEALDTAGFGRRYYNEQGDLVPRHQAVKGSTLLGGDILHPGYSMRRQRDPRALADWRLRSTDELNPVSVPGMVMGLRRGGATVSQGAQLAGLSAVDKLPKFIRSKFNLDTTEARARIEALKAEAAGVRAAGPTVPLGPMEPDMATGPISMRRRIIGAGVSGGMKGVGALAKGFGTLTSVLSDVIGPLGLLAAVGIPLYEGFKHLHNASQQAADNMDDLGAALVRTAGGTYTKPQGGTPPAPADKPIPFGQNEIGVATSSHFATQAGSDIQRLSGRKGINRVRTAQSLVQNVIASNNGQPLSDAQQTALREELIASYGVQGAQEVWNQLNIKGASPAAAAASNAALLAGVKDDSNWLENRFQGTNSSKRIHDAVTPIANQLNSGQFASAALGLTAIDQALPGARVNYSTLVNRSMHGDTTAQDALISPSNDVVRLQRGTSDVVKELNKGVDKSQQIHIDTSKIYSVQDFITQLQHGNARAQEFAKQMTNAGLNVNDLSASFKVLNTAVQNSTTVAQAKKISGTRIGGLAGALGFDLASPTDVNYPRELFSLTSLAERGNAKGMPAMTDTSAIKRAIDAWTAYKNTLEATNPAMQGVQSQIDALNQALQGQNAIFQTPGQMASGYADMASGMISQFGTGGQAGADEQSYINMAQQQVQSAEGQLKSYMMQVHEYRIQEKEAFYQRNQQIMQMNHEFSEQIRQTNFQMANSFGNPAQFVQAQYTEGADQAMQGMQHQVQMLRDSKRTMDQLRNMGLSTDAIRLLGLDDPKNVEQAQRYMRDFAQNPRMIKAFNDSIKGRLKISEGIDTDVNNSKFADMKRQFDYSADQATKAFNHAQEQSAQAINELGQQLYANFAELNKAAMSSGLKNIQNFAAGIVTAIGKVQTATDKFLGSVPGVGVGASGGGGATTSSGVSATGSHKGGGYGNAPVVTNSYSDTINPRTGKPVQKATQSTFYVAPNTGSVYSGGIGGTADTANADYKPTDAFRKAHPADPNFNKSIAKKMAPAWATGAQWAAWDKLWTNESGWSQYSDNPTSSAYGIPQALHPEDMSKYGKDWRTNPATQIAWGINYFKTHIDDRTKRPYGSPAVAWDHEVAEGWYAKGGVFDSRKVIGVGENGPEMVLPLNSTGATFVAQVVAATMARTGVDRTGVAMTHTMPRASVSIGSVTHHTDASTNFNGEVHVEAQDPNEMARKLEAKKRLSALSRPIAGR